jgi:hypothetical protein
MITDPERAVKHLMGQTIEGFEIDEDGQATITCNRGVIFIDFEESEIYIEVDENN